MVDATEHNRERLRAVIDRIIPADADPGALDLGADRYVIAQLAGEAIEFAEDVETGLGALELAAALRFVRPFEKLGDAEKDQLLLEIEEQPWFVALAELTAEGFYTDPANGGNSGARSWTMIGYEHRLPEGPSGPPGAAALSAATLRRR